MSLIQELAAQKIIKDDRFAISHGATVGFLGVGALYYAIPYTLKARICVCLGSGSGFVPKLMRQAQRDLGLAGSETVLVDANIRNSVRAGFPDYYGTETSFTKEYPEVRIMQMTTTDAALVLNNIDYLHVDADHSYEAVFKDFCDYIDLVKLDGVITFHDTESKDAGVKKFINELGREKYDVLNLPIGNGTAVVRRRA